jgi:hypothetical protein
MGWFSGKGSPLAVSSSENSFNEFANSVSSSPMDAGVWLSKFGNAGYFERRKGWFRLFEYAITAAI